MSKCKCGSSRIAHLDARCKDQFYWKSDKGDEYEGYACIPGSAMGQGDNVTFDYCLECGRIQGDFPAPSEFSKAELGDE